MASPDPGGDWVSGLPPIVQAFVTILVAVIIGIGGRLGWKHGKTAAISEAVPPPSQQAVVIGGAFADRKSIERLTDVLERGINLAERHFGDEEARETIRRELRMEAALQELDKHKRGDKT